MRRHADLDGARPLIHHLVDAHLEHFIGAQRTTAQDHTMVEVVRRTVQGKRKLKTVETIGFSGTGNTEEESFHQKTWNPY